MTTGSDRKPVWLLLEATSSNRIKKNVKTAQLFFLYGKALQNAFEVSAFSCPTLWPTFVSLLYVDTADSGFPFNLDKGVIKLLWVISVRLRSFSVQLTVGSLSDQVKISASNYKNVHVKSKGHEKMGIFITSRWYLLVLKGVSQSLLTHDLPEIGELGGGGVRWDTVPMFLHHNQIEMK